MKSRFDILARIAPVGIYETDAANRCIYVSDRCCEILRAPRAALLDRNWERLLHPEDLERVLRTFNGAFAAGRPIDMEYRFVSGGKTIWVQGGGDAVRDEGGHTVGFMGWLHDITAQREAEAAAADEAKARTYAQARERSLWSAIPDVAFVLDAAGSVIDMRSPPGVVRTPRENMMGRGWRDALPAHVVALFEAATARATESGEVQPLDIEFDSALGAERRCFDARVAPVSGGGVLLLARETTRERTAERNLRLLQARLESAQELARLGHWDLDLRGERPYWSRETSLLHGFDPSAPPPRPAEFLRRVHPDDVAKLGHVLAGIGTTTEKRAFSYRFRRGESWAYLRGIARLVPGQGGDPDRLAGVVHDVTDEAMEEERERVESERALRFRQRLFDLAKLERRGLGPTLEAFLRASAGALAVQSASYLDADSGLTSLRCRIEYDGASDSFTTPARELLASKCRAYFSALESRAPLVVEDITLDPRTVDPGPDLPGGLCPAGLLDVPVHRDGMLVGVVSFMQRGSSRSWSSSDVEIARSVADLIALATESIEKQRALDDLRASQARLEEAEELGRLGSAEFDLGSGRVLWSRQALRLLGQPPDAEPGPLMQVFSWFGPEQAATLERAVSRLVEHDVPLDMDLDRVGPGGQKMTLHAVARVVRDFRGRALKVVATLQDVTARKTAEAALVRAREDALAASRVKSQLLANVSHEIRTPLNAVLGMTELALDHASAPEQREYLTAAQGSGHALLALIDDLLDLSRIEAGKLRLESVPYRLGETLNERVHALSMRAKEKGLLVDVELEDGLPEAVIGDPVRVGQVITNLVGNAIKFTPNGSVSVRARKVGVDRIEIRVIDTGIGIPQDRRAHLFDAFTQADGSTTRRFGGTGLGLAICRELVTRMGGQIGLDSTEGAGSCFWFSLPAPAAEATQSLAAEPSAPATSGMRALRVLIADDNDTNALLARRVLEREGHFVTRVADGRMAVSAVESQAFDVVLMDVQMPLMDGIEATRQIREREASSGRRIPIIALTANAMKGDEQTCLGAGMDAYIAKPVHAGRLREMVSRWGGG